MAELGNLIVSLEANMAQFNRNMDDAAKKTEDAGRRMDGAVSAAKTAIIALAG